MYSIVPNALQAIAYLVAARGGVHLFEFPLFSIPIPIPILALISISILFASQCI